MDSPQDQAIQALHRALHLLVSDPLLRNLQIRNYEDDDDGVDRSVVWIHRRALGLLNQALEQHSSLTEINFHGCFFERRNEPTLDELFGRVLPTHGTLTRISFTDCQIDPHYVELLAGALTKAKSTVASSFADTTTASSSGAGEVTSISSLSFTMTPLCHEGVQAIACMVRSNAPTLQRLTLSDCDLDSRDAKLVCDGLSTNDTLLCLDLEDANIVAHGDTLVHALTPTSPLREISLDSVRWTLEGIVTFFTSLRANRTLERIVIRRPEMGREMVPDMPLWVHLFEQLLAHHNFTIRRVEPFVSGTNRYLSNLLQSNEAVRVAHENLQRYGYRVANKSLWPDVLERICYKPSLLQAFLRRGNVAALASHLQEVANCRRRPHPPSPLRR